MITSSKHTSVMTQEVLDFLQAKSAGTYLDCTFGGGGHSRAILASNPDNVVFAIDRDPEALERAQSWLPEFSGRLKLIYGSFEELEQNFSEHKFDGVLADLGTSVDQLEGERGFSFRKDAPLDMRMDPSSSLSASEIVNTFSEQQIYVILRKGGVGNEARSIARAIVKQRPLDNTKKLADLIDQVAQATQKEAGKKRHAATLSFQAIRIAVNDEFQQIESLLDFIPTAMKPKGRAVIISFHSLEDKLVASRMRHWERPDSTPALWAKPNSSQKSLGKLLTRKAILASVAEVSNNSKARSARLRAFEFYGEV